MVIKVQAFVAEQIELLNKAYHIRELVFVQEQKVDKFLEYDGLDEESTHFLLECDDKPAATARYRETEEGIKLERFAVLKEYRGKAFASVILKMILLEVVPSRKLIYLSAQDSAVSFYENYGFKIKGDSFEEANIQHFKMIYSK